MSEQPSPESSTTPLDAVPPAPPNKQNLFAGIILGAIIILSVVVAYLQLRPGDKDSGKASVVVPANPANPASQADPPTSALPHSPDIRQRATATADRLGSDAASLVGMIAQLSEQIDLSEEELAETRALLDLSDRRSEALMAKLADSPDPDTLRDAEAMRDVFEAELRNTNRRPDLRALGSATVTPPSERTLSGYPTPAPHLP